MPVKPTGMEAKMLEEVVRSYYEAFNKHDFEALLKLCDEKVFLEYAESGSRFDGRNQVLHHFEKELSRLKGITATFEIVFISPYAKEKKIAGVSVVAFYKDKEAQFNEKREVNFFLDDRGLITGVEFENIWAVADKEDPL